jgi:hypothetical protein
LRRPTSPTWLKTTLQAPFSQVSCKNGAKPRRLWVKSEVRSRVGGER